MTKTTATFNSGELDTGPPHSEYIFDRLAAWTAVVVATLQLAIMAGAALGLSGLIQE